MVQVWMYTYTACARFSSHACDLLVNLISCFDLSVHVNEHTTTER